MNYISSRGSRLKDEEKYSQYVGEGCCARIYRCDDVILKKYYDSTERIIRLDIDVFKFLKTIDSPFFIKLYDAYINGNYKDFILSFIHLFDFRIDAYTAKYYEESDIDPILYTKSYLLESFYEIEKVIDYLSKNRIAINDLKSDNTVVTKNGIVLVDPDLFKFTMYDKDELSTINKKRLLILFKSFLSECDVEEYSLLKKWFEDNIDCDDITSNTSVTDYLSDKLQYVKKPIDLVRK